MSVSVGPGLSIAVLGLGRVGTTTAACLAEAGHRVHGIDTDPDKVAALAAGRSPVVEPGVEELLRRAARAGSVSAGPSLEAVLDRLDLALVCVGTPAGSDGRLDYRALVDVLRQLGRGLRRRDRSRPPLLVAIRSTLAPGTMDGLVLPTLATEAGTSPGERFEAVFNPEFLREGSALLDHRSPSRIVLGERVRGAARRLLGIYEGIDAPWFEVPFRLAESIKLLDNGFHALKVAFANEMGRLALAAGVAPELLAEAFLADRRLNLSTAYLRPGGAYGGPCLPKDLAALLAFGRDAGLELPLLAAARRSNARHLDFILRRIRAILPPPGPILLLGLTFKTGTDDLRDSPNLALAERLLRAGYDLEVVDPDLDPGRLSGANFAIAAAHHELLRRRLTTDLEGAARRARLVVVAKTLPGLAGRLPDELPVVDIPRLRLP